MKHVLCLLGRSILSSSHWCMKVQCTITNKVAQKWPAQGIRIQQWPGQGNALSSQTHPAFAIPNRRFAFVAATYLQESFQFREIKRLRPR